MQSVVLLELKEDRYQTCTGWNCSPVHCYCSFSRVFILLNDNDKTTETVL